MIDGNPTVVLLDDETLVLEGLGRVLRAAGFRTLTTTSQREAMEWAVQGRAAVVVADLHMPGLPGATVLSMIARSAPCVGRVLLTADPDFPRIAALLAPGAAQAFVSKTDAVARLPAVVREMLEQRALAAGGGALEANVRALANGIVRALALRDYETESHCHRVASLSALLARRVGLSGTELLNAELGALLHDMGKIGVRDAVLLKPGKLTEEEWVEMRRHPELGAQLLADMPLLRGAVDVVLNHHERWQGGGYPRNLRGEQIPIAARIFQIADAYDAIVSDRPYRKGQSPDVARAEIARHAGTQFDPDVVRAFQSIDPAEWDAASNAADTMGPAGGVGAAGAPATVTPAAASSPVPPSTTATA